MSLIIKGTDGIFDNIEQDVRMALMRDDIQRILREHEQQKEQDKADDIKMRQALQDIGMQQAPAPRPRPVRRPMPVKSERFLGTLVTYKNVPQLANKLSIGDTIKERRENAIRALKNVNAEKVIYNPITGAFAPISLKSPPRLIRQFTGVPRVMKSMRNEVLTAPLYEYVDEQVNDIAVQIYDKSIPFKADDIVQLYVDVSFRIIHSGTDGTRRKRSFRRFATPYTGVIGDSKYFKHGFVLKDVHEGQEEKPEYYEAFNPDRLASNASADTIHRYANHAEPIELSAGLHKDIVATLVDLYSFPWAIIFENVDIRTANQTHVFDLPKMRLRAIGYDDIKKNLYNEAIDITETDDNCVMAYLTKTYDKLDVRGHFKDINIEDGINTEQIIGFCELHKIKCIAYDIELNVIMSHFPDIKRKQYKSLIYIAYNNHIYPVNNKSLHKVATFQQTVGADRTKSDAKPKKKDRPIEMCRLKQGKINKQFKALLSQKIIPSHITIDTVSDIGDYKMDGLSIRAYAHDNVFYFVNDDYDDLLKLLTLYGLQDKMTPFTTMYNVTAILEELYGVGGLYSFAPHLKDIRMQGYMYHIDKIPTPEEEKQFMTLDKRKAYPYALSCLKFIQTLDVRTCKVVENPTEIKETWAYIARPHKCCILMHSTNYYDGDHLLFCKKYGVEFDLLYGFEAKTHENPFRSMIDDYYGKTDGVKFNDDQLIKSILNIWIGKMEKGCGTVSNRLRLRKICNRDEAMLSKGTIMNYDDNTALCFDKHEKADIYTRKPISFQIKNMARRVLFLKMIELGIEDNDVVQICVDSVTFINKNNVTYTNDTSYKGWKHDKYNRLQWSSYQRCTNDIMNIVKPPARPNVLFEAYAGHGKTHWITTKLIPKIIAKKKSYIVLSPSHSTIKEYRLAGLRCDVIQRYEHHELPTEEIIIIDEIGLCGKKANDTIYRLMTLGKLIYSFGDYNQLLPVNEDAHFNNKIYIDSVYKVKRTFKNNHRNGFTKEYYDSLINMKVNVIDEIKKHNVKDPHKADIVVCYRNETRKKMNDMIMKKKDIAFGAVGCKVMCKVNKFRDLDIYNNFDFTITCVTDEHITLDNRYELTKKQFFGGSDEAPHFVPAYARTMYNMQGDACKSYHVPNEDMKFFNNGRSAYTLISRLKTEK